MTHTFRQFDFVHTSCTTLIATTTSLAEVMWSLCFHQFQQIALLTTKSRFAIYKVFRCSISQTSPFIPFHCLRLPNDWLWHGFWEVFPQALTSATTTLFRVNPVPVWDHLNSKNAQIQPTKNPPNPRLDG